MKTLTKDLYLAVGRILNDPKSFGLTEGAPKQLVSALTSIQHGLFQVLNEELGEEDSLIFELSQDADRVLCKERTKTPVLRKTGS